MRLTTNKDPRPDPHARRTNQAPTCDVCTVETRPHGDNWRCPNCGNVMRSEDKVSRIKAQIAAGTYESDDKLDAATDAMLAEVVPVYRKVRDPEPRAMTWAEAFAIRQADRLGWRPQLTYPRLADDERQDVPGQRFMFGDEGQVPA